MSNCKVLIADDHNIMLQGLVCFLESQEEVPLRVLATAHDGEEMLKLIREIPADLAIIDLNMPDRDGLDILPDIKKMQPGLKVMTLTMYDDSKLVKKAFKLGIDGYVLKGSSPTKLLIGIREVMDGKRHFGEGVSMNPQSQRRTDAKIDQMYEDKFVRKYKLTRREVEVLFLITQALSNKEIAKELFISDQTVSVHRKNLMRKLGVSNTAALIKFAFDKSLV